MAAVMSSTTFLPITISDLFYNTRGIGIDDFTALVLITLLTAGYFLRGIVWDKPDPYHHVWFERPQENAGAARNQETRDIAQKLEEAVRADIFRYSKYTSLTL